MATKNNLLKRYKLPRRCKPKNNNSEFMNLEDCENESDCVEEIISDIVDIVSDEIISDEMSRRYKQEITHKITFFDNKSQEQSQSSVYDECILFLMEKKPKTQLTTSESATIDNMKFVYQFTAPNVIPDGDSHDLSKHKQQTKKRKKRTFCSEQSPISVSSNSADHPSSFLFKKKLKLEHTATVQSSEQFQHVADKCYKSTQLPPVLIPKYVKQKTVQSDPAKILYCYCRRPYDKQSSMIGCDGPNCQFEWFHFNCVNITIVPKGKWYCPTCRSIRKK